MVPGFEGSESTGDACEDFQAIRSEVTERGAVVEERGGDGKVNGGEEDKAKGREMGRETD